jgi:hypothetical protein
MVKRGVIDTLRRGLDNTLANWQVILLRLGGRIVLGAMAVAAAIVVIVPIVISIGLHIPDINAPEDVLDVLTALIRGWALLLWILVAVTGLLLVMVAIHSFVEAGCARIAVDADRAAGPGTEGPRARFGVFAMSRWLEGGGQGWWPVFWIYNLAWGSACMFLLIPLIPTLVLMMLLRGSDTAVIVTGVAGLLLTLLLFFFVAIVCAIWTNRAIAGWAAHHESARAALRAARGALKLDLARHVLIALAIFVVGMAGSSFFAGFGTFAAIGHALSRATLIHFVTMPLRLAGWLAGSAFSSAVSAWYLASYVAVAVESQNPARREGAGSPL